MVVSNPDSVISYTYFSGEVQAGKTPVPELALPAVSVQSDSAETDLEISTPAADNALFSDPILVINQVGFHARPAAVLAGAAKKYNAQIRLEKDGKKADAKSVMRLMTLNVRFQDYIRIVPSGPEAEAAIKDLVHLIQSGLGDDFRQKPTEQKPSSVQPDSATFAELRKTGIDDPNLFVGIPAAPGLVSGRVFRFRQAESVVNEQGSDPQATEQEENIKKTIQAAFA